MDVDIVDAAGASVGAGDVGELVCRQPWPAMARGIWGDRERYLETYWRRFPGIWVHGDWASRDDDGYWFLHGRSDDTLSVAGKRLGPAEVESALASHPAVAESAAIGVPDAIKGEQIWCVVVLTPGTEPNETLEGELAGDGRRASRSLVPARAHPLRAGASPDPQREDRAPRDQGGRDRRRSRRSLEPREPRFARRDPRGVLLILDRRHPSSASRRSDGPTRAGGGVREERVAARARRFTSAGVSRRAPRPASQRKICARMPSAVTATTSWRRERSSIDRRAWSSPR